MVFSLFLVYLNGLDFILGSDDLIVAKVPFVYQGLVGLLAAQFIGMVTDCTIIKTLVLAQQGLGNPLKA